MLRSPYLLPKQVVTNAIEKYSVEQSNPVNFDKKKYNELVKKILRTKSPSFLTKRADKTFKELFYLGGHPVWLV